MGFEFRAFAQALQQLSQSARLLLLVCLTDRVLQVLTVRKKAAHKESSQESLTSKLRV
jgi:hypothetical protein